MDTAQCREVIITTQKRRGNGTQHSPIRVITEVFEKDGTKIAEHDPSPETFTLTDMLKFCFCHKSKSSTLAPVPQDVYDWLDSIKKETP